MSQTKESKQPVANTAVIYVVVGLLLGMLLIWSITASAVNGNHKQLMNSLGLYPRRAERPMATNQDMTMTQMTQGLQGKSGDDLDQAFLAEMIMHHQGAVDMAQLVKTNGKHDELKQLANNIITSQTTEINQMKTWQTDWGYNTPTDNHSMNMDN